MSKDTSVPGEEEKASSRSRALIATWEAETEVLYARMQRPGFAEGVRKALEAPLSADLSDAHPKPQK